MEDVSPEQAATFFHTVEVSLNQTTTVVGWLLNTAKVHAIDSKPKAKPRAKAASSPERVKTASAPSTPVRSEGPAPPTTPAPRDRLPQTRRVNNVFGFIEGTVLVVAPVSMDTFWVRMGNP